MKITLGQFNRMIREAAAAAAVNLSDKNSASRRADVSEDDSPTMPVEPDLYESQRGDDEGGQHDNDTDPGDPNISRLAEAALRDLRRAAQILRRK